MAISSIYPTSRPSLLLDFAKSERLDPLITFTRASTGTYIDQTGTLRTALVNRPRITHDSTGKCLGLLVEEARTNSIHNNTMVGAVAGTPGTLPTDWLFNLNGVTGITLSVVGTGAQNGVNYVDLRAIGTPSATVVQGIQILFAPNGSTIAASASQTWTESAYVAIVSGSATNISQFVFNCQQFNGGSFVASNNVSFTPGTVLARYSGTVTFSASTTTGVIPLIGIGVTSGATIDITLRIGLPQLEQGAFATSVIPTTGTAATRAADIATITGSAFSSWYRQDEGTLFVAGKRVAYSGASSPVNISDSGINNQLAIRQDSATAGFALLSIAGTNTAAPALTYLSTSADDKTCISYNANIVAAATTSFQSASTSPAGTPVVSQMNIGSRVNSGSFIQHFNGTISRLTYWPRRLPDPTLQELTK